MATDRVLFNDVAQNAYSQLTTALGGSPPVFDYTPHNQAMPFVRIGNFSQVAVGVKSEVNQGRVRLQVDVFDDSPGTKPLNVILDNVVAALTADATPVEGGGKYIHNPRLELVEVVEEYDSDAARTYRHGIVQIDYVIVGVLQ